MTEPYLFAGDRRLALDALNALIAAGDPPAALCVSDGRGASHASDLTAAFHDAGGQIVIESSRLHEDQVVAMLGSLDLEVALNVHLPAIIREPVLSMPREGWLNLHPAYLPYNRGWHTPSWAILEGTPAGVTLHRMVAEVDAGAIIAQRQVATLPSDTAHDLYQRLLTAELELLLEVWPSLRSGGEWPELPNELARGTVHRREELLNDRIRRIDLEAPTTAKQLIDRLRGLTTNRWEEAAWFEVDGVRYQIRVDIAEDGRAQRPIGDVDPIHRPAD